MITSRKVQQTTNEFFNYVYFARRGSKNTVHYIEQLACNLNLDYSETVLISEKHLLMERDGLQDKMAIMVKGDGDNIVRFIAEANRLFEGDR